MDNSAIFPASLSKLESMLDWVCQKLEHFGVEERKSKRIQLAIEEALVNIIFYAYPPPAGDLEIKVAYFKENKILEFTIQDQGLPFNPLEYKKLDITSDIQHRQPGGLGIHFLKQVSDDLIYQRHGNYNVLSIRNQI